MSAERNTGWLQAYYDEGHLMHPTAEAIQAEPDAPPSTYRILSTIVAFAVLLGLIIGFAAGAAWS